MKFTLEGTKKEILEFLPKKEEPKKRGRPTKEASEVALMLEGEPKEIVEKVVMYIAVMGLLIFNNKR